MIATLQTVGLAMIAAAGEILWAQESRAEPRQDDAYTKAVRHVDQWLRIYPGFVQKMVIGETVEGRELFVLRISKSEHDNVPEMFLGAGIHGNEGSEEDALKMVLHLLALSEELEKLLTERVLWVQLLMNPDGAAHRQRKNARGVDLNRNFGHRWFPTQVPSSQQYQGPEPFSEAESRAVRDFLRSRPNLRVYLDLHRSARLIYIPEVGGLEGKLAPECLEAFRALDAAMGGYHPGDAPYRREFSGGYSIDWVWKDLGVIAFTWELPSDDGPGFPEDHRWKGLLHLLRESAAFERQPR